MSNKNLSDKEIEQLFKDSDKNTKLSHKDSANMTRKIVSKAKTETSAKTLTEYSLINFWTVLLEFITVFFTLVSPKNANTNNDETNKEQS
jgi:hypothetical protein